MQIKSKFSKTEKLFRRKEIINSYKTDLKLILYTGDNKMCHILHVTHLDFKHLSWFCEIKFDVLELTRYSFLLISVSVEISSRKRRTTTNWN